MLADEKGVHMRNVLWIASLAGALTGGSLIALSGADSQADARLLATVRIPSAVMAGGTSLSPGIYMLRLTGERPVSPVGQPQNAQEWVEFAKDGQIVGREAAEILYDDELPAVGASSQRAKQGTRVDLLKGGEFLRISVKREHDRYLIHLPVQAD